METKLGRFSMLAVYYLRLLTMDFYPDFTIIVNALLFNFFYYNMTKFCSKHQDF